MNVAIYFKICLSEGEGLRSSRNSSGEKSDYGRGVGGTLLPQI